MNNANSEIKASILSAFIPQGPSASMETPAGNPAGVVLDADALSEDDMLTIARKIGLSETAFVSRSATEGFKLDFFTPTRRIAHCGHATIATFSYLAETGRARDGETSKETVDGPRKIFLRDGEAYMEQLAPRYEEPGDWADRGVSASDVLASLGLEEADLDTRQAPLLVNTGNSFIVIGVKDAEILKSLKPDQGAIDAISEKLDLIGYYVFTTAVQDGKADATTRMFAPRYGIEEESATGMAAGPLACLLHDKLGLDKTEFLISQGHFMDAPSPSEIRVTLNLEHGRITGLMAGGRGRLVRELTISL